MKKLNKKTLKKINGGTPAGTDESAERSDAALPEGMPICKLKFKPLPYPIQAP